MAAAMVAVARADYERAVNETRALTERERARQLAVAQSTSV